MRVQQFVMLYFVLWSTFLSAQNLHKTDKASRQTVNSYIQKKTKLTMDQLLKASEIIYHSDNGSLPPDYHYDCFIKVRKNNVNVIIYGGYNGNVKYNEVRTISSSEYRHFIHSLAKQDIYKVSSNQNVPNCGTSSESLTIKTKNQIIFAGDEDIDLSVTNGELIDSFWKLLSSSMKQAVEHPERFLEK